MEFYSMSFEELLHLDVTWFCNMYDRIAQIEATRHLNLLQVIAYPHMKPEHGKKVITALQKAAIGPKPLDPTQDETLPNPADRGQISHGWWKLRTMGMKAD